MNYKTYKHLTDLKWVLFLNDNRLLRLELGENIEHNARNITLGKLITDYELVYAQDIWGLTNDGQPIYYYIWKRDIREPGCNATHWVAYCGGVSLDEYYNGRVKKDDYKYIIEDLVERLDRWEWED